jgi:hypothetical protein
MPLHYLATLMRVAFRLNLAFGVGISKDQIRFRVYALVHGFFELFKGVTDRHSVNALKILL